LTNGNKDAKKSGESENTPEDKDGTGKDTDATEQTEGGDSDVRDYPLHEALNLLKGIGILKSK
jgi:carboxyl-terminal processing protease